MSEEFNREEKLRVCPSCRCNISVLATKCRFCGEEVGKPKDETRELSSQDLGGETIHHTAASQNIMDAIESFRKEEQSVTDEETGGPEMRVLSTMPELDANSQDLASVSQHPSGVFSTRTVAQPQAPDTPASRLLRFGAIAVALVLLLFGGVKGGGWALNYLGERNLTVEVELENNALNMIRRGDDPLKALAEAANIVRLRPNDANKKIAAEVLLAVRAKFSHYIEADPWSMNAIANASVIADNAARIYRSDVSLAMKKEAAEEINSYRIMLRRVDTNAGTATFGLIKPARKEVTAKIGEAILGRFEITRVRSHAVEVRDTKRKRANGAPRVVVFDLHGLPHPAH